MGKKDKEKKDKKDKKKGGKDVKAEGPPSPKSAPRDASFDPGAPPSIPSGENQLSSIMMMDEKPNSDVIFTLSDGKTINSHSFVLQFRCPKLYDMYLKKKPKGKSARKPVTVDMKENMDPYSFRVLVQYMYADNIAFPDLTHPNVLNVIYAAHQLDLQRLARLGEEHLRSNLSLDMVFTLLKGASEMGEVRVKDFCMDYAHANMHDFIKRKEDARGLGVELFQEVVSLSLEEYKPPPPDTTPIPPNTLHEDFAKLYSSTKGGETDAFVNIAGDKIYFHRAVICAHTKPFASSISSAKDDDMTDVLGVTGMEPDAFRSVLKFVYYGDEDITPLLACDCAPFAKRFDAYELQRITESVIAHNISANNVLPILKVAYLQENMDRPEMASLRAHCLMFLTQHIAQVNLDPLMGLDIRISVDILRAWQKTAL